MHKTAPSRYAGCNLLVACSVRDKQLHKSSKQDETAVIERSGPALKL